MSEPTGAAEHLRRWMRKVMEETHWNAQEWATKAGTSPTNITRFLKGSDHVPSYATLVKLALAAGKPIPTPGVAQRERPKVRIPLLDSGELSRCNAASTVKALLQETRQRVVADTTTPRAFAIRLESCKFAAMGYLAGDILVVDPDYTPEPGKHVLVTNGTASGPCVYDPPFIICVAGQKKVKIETTTIIGTVVELIRKMI